MDTLWLIGIFLGVDLLCGSSLAHISVLPISKDFNGHGTQYRFQYYVRDERGDYKTQEEAGEGGKSRGSYAVEEPDGDLRIVQYTADLGGGFKAHIKVDHAGKSPSKIQDIDIPAEEMRKLIESNRRKTVREVITGKEEKEEEEEFEKSSKSYVLGPPRKMSEIVMEQAAAIREIISKEIEAEEKREAEEKLRNENNKGKKNESSIDVVDCEKKTEIRSQGSENSGKNEKPETEKASEISFPSLSSVNRTPKLRRIEREEEEKEKKSAEISAESLQSSQILKKNSEILNTADLHEIKKDASQSPVVRVTLTPRKIEDLEKASKKLLQIPESGVPVRNFSFKNRIMFYKPSEINKPIESVPEVVDSSADLKRVSAELFTNLGKNGEDINKDNKQIVDREEIVLYSPYPKNGELKEEGDRNSRFITVPYEVLRPYLTQIDGDEEKNK